MNCLTGKDTNDNEIDIEIYGPEEITPHKRLEFYYRPCIPKPKTRYNQNESCLIDLSTTSY